MEESFRYFSIDLMMMDTLLCQLTDHKRLELNLVISGNPLLQRRGEESKCNFSELTSAQLGSALISSYLLFDVSSFQL